MLERKGEYGHARITVCQLQGARAELSGVRPAIFFADTRDPSFPKAGELIVRFGGFDRYVDLLNEALVQVKIGRLFYSRYSNPQDGRDH